MATRRDILIGGATALAGTALFSRKGLADVPRGEANGSPRTGEYVPVVTPNGSTLPWKVVDGVKVFHLIAEQVRREFAPGLVVDCWGYNGQTPGPTIEVAEGDRCRFYVTNRLEEPTTVHWHGVLLPNGMDGVSGLTQKRIQPGQTFRYEFTFIHPGTFMYHPHFDEMVQMGMGMMGMIVVHPRERETRPVDRDFVVMLSEWAIRPGTSKPDPTVMNEFNILTMNSKAFPGTDPLVVRLGQRVRVRLGNLGATDHHPIHLHGHRFVVTGTDGGRIPEAAQWPETTILVPVGSTREIEFVADAAGDWPFHCHMTHHIMNQMGHGLPNMLGVRTGGLDAAVQKSVPDYMTMGTAGMGEMGDMSMPGPKNSIAMQSTPGPFDPIDMGGMFTILKVREGITSYSDPGWYSHPDGSVAHAVSAEQVRADLGVDALSSPKKRG